MDTTAGDPARLYPGPRVGHAVGFRVLERRLPALAPVVRTYRLHGHLDLDGSRARPVRDSAHQSRQPDAGEYQDLAGASTGGGSGGDRPSWPLAAGSRFPIGL